MSVIARRWDLGKSQSINALTFLYLCKIAMQQVIRLSLTDVLDETEAALDAGSPVLFVSSHSRQEKVIFAGLLVPGQCLMGQVHPSW